MNLLNWIYRIFGFESDDVKIVKKKPSNPQKATYNLKVTQKLPDEIDGVQVFYPQDFEEAKEKVELLKKGNAFFMDFRNMNTAEKNKTTDYFSGAIEVLDAKFEYVDKNLYIFLPKNMQLERQ